MLYMIHHSVSKQCLRITPAPYEKAQASDGICKRAAHPGTKLNQKNVVVGRACACACLHVWMHGCIRSRDECTQQASIVSNQHAQILYKQYNERMHAIQCMHVRECRVSTDGHASCGLSCMMEQEMLCKMQDGATYSRTT